MTVYVLHFEPPYRHAAHYIGYTPDETAARRFGEHLRGVGSPLVKAALKAGSRVVLAHEYPAAGRDFERSLKARRDTKLWCGCCGVHRRPHPSPARITEAFRAKNVWGVA